MKYFFLLPFILLFQLITAQQQVSSPKLIVGIVVDQMRNDYIYRYWERYGNGGFKRLVNEGYYFRNCHYNYIPTYTGPGHCSIYTGTTPRAHGIIANEWFVKTQGKETYCVLDSAVKTIGSNSKAGQMSPQHQKSSTIGDEMKISSNGKAKVFAVALKDRSAILPAGHAADGAFWFDDASGNFISSSWYMQELPGWLKVFNDKKLPAKYLQQDWNTLAYPEGYTNSLPDNNPYEGVHNGKDKPTFPYSYKQQVESGKWSIIKSTPYGNSLTKDLAIECLKSENLGKDAITDLLSISFSSPDIIAHTYGPRAMEVEDVYLRLDKDLEELLKSIDQLVGTGQYVVFLTADHGGADVPKHLMDNKIPAGYLSESKLFELTNSYLEKTYGEKGLISSLSNEQIFLNEKKIAERKLDISVIETDLCKFLVGINGVAEAYPSGVMKFSNFDNNDLRSLLQNGYNHKMSGNVCIVLNPAWMDYAEKGTTHGAGYNYDTHVPLIFFGKGIAKGETHSYTGITQIAPTICELIKINQPNACISEPLNDKIK